MKRSMKKAEGKAKCEERNAEGSIVVLIDAARCDGCGNCIPACAFGAIWLHPRYGKAVKCDLCYGLNIIMPCVKFCPTGALRFHAEGDFP
jgi:Fe-S-cluster-containing hydrogenase component 2